MANHPPLPGGDDPPSSETMAGLLAGLLPEADREEGRRILEEEVLPYALGEMATHPRPRALAEVVYEKLGEQLLESDDPAATVREMAMREQVEDLGRRSLSLAITRYAKDHPDAEEAARGWLVDGADEYLGMSVEKIQEKAGEGLAELDRVEARAREFPDVWETVRIEANYARLAFQSARSGSFETSGGPLRDFLSEIGEAPDDFMIH